MKFLKLASFPTETDEQGVHLMKLLVAIEETGETFYYDAEAHREIIVIHRDELEPLVNVYFKQIGKPFKLRLENDFLSEADRAFLVLASDVLYAVSRRDVGYYLDMLVARVEAAEPYQ